MPYWKAKRHWRPWLLISSSTPVRAGLCADPRDYCYSGCRGSCQGFSSCPSRYQNHSGPAGDAAILAIYIIAFLKLSPAEAIGARRRRLLLLRFFVANPGARGDRQNVILTDRSLRSALYDLIVLSQPFDEESLVWKARLKLRHADFRKYRIGHSISLVQAMPGKPTHPQYRKCM